MKFSFSRLSAYTASAAAALASAKADPLYSGPQNVGITAGSSFALDLNLDGQTDITLKNYVFSGGSYQGATVNFAPGRIVGFTAGPNSFAYVSNLAPGSLINSATAGPTFFGSMAYGANNPNAQFNNATGAFIGLSFTSTDGLRYAWVRLDINNTNGTFMVDDWAYESTVGAGITAGAGAAVPEPSSLGLLALGAAGLAAFRLRRRSA